MAKGKAKIEVGLSIISTCAKKKAISSYLWKSLTLSSWESIKANF